MFDLAIEAMKRAMRLSPYYPIWYLSNLGEALTMAGHLKEAILVNKKLVERGQKKRTRLMRLLDMPGWLLVIVCLAGKMKAGLMLQKSSKFIPIGRWNLSDKFTLIKTQPT